MSSIEEMKRLHQLYVKGETLTEEEKKSLEDWYQEMDNEESSVLKNSIQTQETQKLQEQISKTSEQISKISLEIGSLNKQNETLRNENQKLKELVEKRLLEKVA